VTRRVSILNRVTSTPSEVAVSSPVITALRRSVRRRAYAAPSPNAIAGSGSVPQSAEEMLPRRKKRMLGSLPCSAVTVSQLVRALNR
jgi:hypothetical protein